MLQHLNFQKTTEPTEWSSVVIPIAGTRYTSMVLPSILPSATTYTGGQVLHRMKKKVFNEAKNYILPLGHNLQALRSAVVITVFYLYSSLESPTANYVASRLHIKRTLTKGPLRCSTLQKGQHSIRFL